MLGLLKKVHNTHLNWIKSLVIPLCSVFSLKSVEEICFVFGEWDFGSFLLIIQFSLLLFQFSFIKQVAQLNSAKLTFPLPTIFIKGHYYYFLEEYFHHFTTFVFLLIQLLDVCDFLRVLLIFFEEEVLLAIIHFPLEFKIL